MTSPDGGGPSCPNLSLVVEIEQFRRLGMTAMDAIVAATGQAAACLGCWTEGTRNGFAAERNRRAG